MNNPGNTRIIYVSMVHIICWLLILSCVRPKENTSTDWCDQSLRPIFQSLEEIKVSSSWFKVYVVGKNVFAIAEPYNYEEVISFLILGSERALLFDTGNGFDSISIVVKELTNLPVLVINSHTHFDHIGGNHEFENILALNTPFTLNNANNGWKHEFLKGEVKPESFCLKMIPHFDTANYYVRPFHISEFVEDGAFIDLGERILEVIFVPGHTPDAIALLDRGNGYLWTGDTFYEAMIYLFSEGTDLVAYENSIAKLAALSPTLGRIFPAHNEPIADPERLSELVKAFDHVTNEIIEKVENEERVIAFDENEEVVYEFDDFSFLFRGDHLNKYIRVR